MSQNFKSASLEVRTSLWNLQKELLATLKSQYDQEVGYNAPPTEWFQVLTTSQRYSWLKELTSLMADIDVLTELEHISEQYAQEARAEIQRLLFDENPQPETFSKKYRDLLTASGNLLPYHSQLRAHTDNLPHDASLTDTSEARKRWQEEHRIQQKAKRN